MYKSMKVRKRKGILKCIKMMAVSSLFGLIILSQTSIAMAGSTTERETEPNNTIEDANLIDRNNEKPSTVASGKLDGRNMVNGHLDSTTDVDWYKVVLMSSSDYNILDFRVSSGSLDVEMYNTNKELMKGCSFKNLSNTSKRTHYLDILQTGTYYIKVFNPSSNYVSYNFTVGSPIYLVSTYSKDFGYISSSTTKELNLENDNTVKKDALVYRVEMNYGSYSGIDSRKFTNASQSFWTTTFSSTGEYPVAVVKQNKLNQRWSFQYNLSNRARSSKASVKLNYVYPYIPENEE